MYKVKRGGSQAERTNKLQAQTVTHGEGPVRRQEAGAPGAGLTMCATGFQNCWPAADRPWEAVAVPSA